MQSNRITILKTEFQRILCWQPMDFILTIPCVLHLIHTLPFSGISEKVSFFVLKTHSWPARQHLEHFSLGVLAAISKTSRQLSRGLSDVSEVQGLPRWTAFYSTKISLNNSVATEHGIPVNYILLYKSLCSGKSEVWHLQDKFIAFSYFLPVQMQLSTLRLFFIINNAFEL